MKIKLGNNEPLLVEKSNGKQVDILSFAESEKAIAAAINEVGIKVIETTYGELLTLRAHGLLIPGMWYQITDHEPSGWEQVIAEGHGFDVLVLATGNDTLSEIARAKARLSMSSIIKAYKTDAEEYPDEVDYTDYFLYTGNTMEFDGDTYYVWQKYENDEMVDYLALTKELYHEGDVDTDNPSPNLIPINSDGEKYGHDEDVFVEIVEEGGGDYFADKNIDAWQLLFSLDNDTERFPWATDDNNGVIYGVNYGNGYEKNGLKDYGLGKYKPVDLGIILNDMPLLFADKNIGADKPTDAGLYFSWGNIVGHKAEDGYDFKGHYNNGVWSGPYSRTPGADLDRDIPAGAAYDAAHALLGGHWRLPTKDEFEKLADESDSYEIVEVDGINGMQFTKGDNSVFIPIAGFFNGASRSGFGSDGHCWLSTTKSDDVAYSMLLNSNDAVVYNDDRSYGFPIRPFYDNSYVDLGLPSGTKWATMNIGARKPEEAGLYFSWGNIIGHDEDSGYNFDQTTYNGTPGISLSGNVPVNDTYDAARKYRAGNWRLPTKEDFEELINKDYTVMKWTSRNGIYGRLITSNINGKSIFIPAAGNFNGTSRNNFGSIGFYWSSTFVNSYYAYRLNFYSSNVSVGNDYRYYGLPVRPVQD